MNHYHVNDHHKDTDTSPFYSAVKCYYIRPGPPYRCTSQALLLGDYSTEMKNIPKRSMRTRRCEQEKGEKTESVDKKS